MELVHENEKCFSLGTISFYKAYAFKLTYHESLKDKKLKCSHLHHKEFLFYKK